MSTEKGWKLRQQKIFNFPATDIEKTTKNFP